MNKFKEFFENNNSNYLSKYEHYLDAYDRHLAKYVDKEITVVEFGINQGGSLNMWRDYFGDKVKIVGIDINPDCQKLAKENIEILIGDQDDKKFIQSVANHVKSADVVIDDGGHMMNQQIDTFDILYPIVKENGVYICEDLHTSYWKGYGGGYKKKGTFIEYSKNFIDMLNAWHSKQKTKLSICDFTRTTDSVHYYDSMIVIEKGEHKEPRLIESGNMVVAPFKIKKKNIFRKIKDYFQG